MKANLPTWAQKLLGAGANPRDALLDEIEALGESARPALVALVRGDVVGHPPAPDEEDDASPRGYAVELLARLPADEATIDACIAAISTPVDSHTASAVEDALADWGDAATTAMLAAIPRSSPDLQDLLAGFLARSHGPDARILALLLDRVRADPKTAADLADYDDPSALPELGRLLAAYVVDSTPTIDGHSGVFELEGAILRLGGELTPAQNETVEKAHRRFRRAMRDAGVDVDRLGDSIATLRESHRRLAGLARERRALGEQ